MPSSRMHFQDRLEKELASLSEWKDLRDKWFHGSYSTSKHLHTLYGIAYGLNAKKIGEIGFGRSSYVLLSVAEALGGELITCDRFDYRKLYKEPTHHMTYILGDADKFYKSIKTEGLDFLFLDYMSTRKKSVEDCYSDFKKALKRMKTNGIIAVHDAIGEKYNVGDALEKLKDKYGKGIEVLTLPYCYGLGLIRNKRPSKYGKLVDVWKKEKEDR